MRIRLKDGLQIVCTKVYLLSIAQTAILNEQIALWLQDRIIAPAKLPWAFPLVPVAKKDGKTRWAKDFRALYASTIANSYSIPIMGEVLSNLAGNWIFSSLDALQAFHNIPIKEESQEPTAFILALGTYKFQRMPFGLRNSRAKNCRHVMCTNQPTPECGETANQEAGPFLYEELDGYN